MIGGGSKVRTDVPPFIKADRDPLSYMGLNSVGLTRRGFEKERIDEIHNIYRAIYQSKMNFSQALEYVENEFKPSLTGIIFLNLSENQKEESSGPGNLITSIPLR